jgi:purine-binding chemotaxis protein CheW
MTKFSGPQTRHVLVFSLDANHYALPLSVVDRVIRLVEITPLPKAPDFISGIINVHGLILPVIDLRRRLGLLSRALTLEDRVIIARDSRRTMGILADSIVGVPELSDREFICAKTELPYVEGLQGLAKIDDELVLIYDLDRFLSFDQETVLAGT